MPGTLNHSPADIVREVLIQIGQGSDPDLGDDWPVYESGEPDSPDNCVTVYDTQGRDDGRSMPDGERAEFHGIQVRIRSQTSKEGFVKARAMAIAMDTEVLLEEVDVDAYTYRVNSLNRTSDVLPLGKDSPGSKRSLFTINLVTSIRQIENPSYAYALLNENGGALLNEDGSVIALEEAAIIVAGATYYPPYYYNDRYFPVRYF